MRQYGGPLPVIPGVAVVLVCPVSYGVYGVYGSAPETFAGGNIQVVLPKQGRGLQEAVGCAVVFTGGHGCRLLAHKFMDIFSYGLAGQFYLYVRPVYFFGVVPESFRYVEIG